MLPYLAALLSALLMWAAFPPLDLGIVGLLAPAPLIWGIRRSETGIRAIAAGLLFGAVLFGLLLNYVVLLGFVAWLPLTLWLGATAAMMTFGIWLFRLWPPTRFWLIATGIWVLWEFVRSVFPWGGFPWGLLGYATGGVPGFIGAVQWIGPSGWSVLSVAVSTGLVLTIEDRTNWRLAVDPAAVVLLLVVAGSVFAPSADGDSIEVAIVQGGTPCPGTHCQNENQRIYERHLQLTTVLEAGVDLVVWAENSMGHPYEPVANPDVAAAIVDEAARLGTYMLVSGTRIEGLGPDEFLNTNRMYAPTGEFVGEYVKRHPVPFGEFVPLRGLLDFIPQLDQVPRDMVRGEGPVVFPTPRGVIGSVISFEGSFSRLVRSEAQEGAELLVVATNESSYGDRSAVPSDQLIGLTRVNAAAVGLPTVHAAITGKSVFIDADGSLGAATDILTEEVHIGRVSFRSAGPTIFTRLGDWLQILSIVAAAAAVFVPGRDRPEPRRRRGEVAATSVKEERSGGNG